MHWTKRLIETFGSAANAAHTSSLRQIAIEGMEPRVLMSYAPAGPDFLVNEVTAGSQSLGSYGNAVAVDAAGNFVVTYTTPDGSGTGIAARRFDGSGNPLGGEFRVNTTTYANQSNSAVAMDGAGDFVIVWLDNYNDTKTSNGCGVYGQRYNAQGVAQGAEFRVNTTTAGAQLYPSVEMDGGGNFVVVWSSEGQDTKTKSIAASTGVYGQRFDAQGQRLGGEFAVNTYQPNTQTMPNIAGDGSGNFIVAWQSYLQDGSGYGIYAQRFDPAAQKVGGEFRVNDVTAGEQQAPRVGIGSGGFTISWRRGTETTSQGVYAKRYTVSASGTVVAAPEFRVDASLPVGGLPGSVAYDDAGNSLIAWSSHYDSTDSDAFAQKYDASGGAVGGAFMLNSTTAGKQYNGYVVFQPDGNFVGVFRGPDAGGNADVFARRFLSDMTTAEKTASPTLSAFSETPIAGAGADGALDSTTDPITTQVLS